jgi:peptidoglycan pentaglycine glycine transferase (the first glycine)
MSVTIQEIFDREQWNSFLIRQPRGHLLQSYEWGELNKYLGVRIYRLGALDGERLVGAMQLAVASVPFPGLRFNWLYSARGPAIEDQDMYVLAQLVGYAHEVARQERAVVLRVEPNIADDDPDMDRWLASYYKVGFRSNQNSVHGRRAWVLDIRPSSEELLANFRPTWRRNVRIAERKNVVIREATSEADLDTYYELLKITSERDDFFIPGKDYHKEVVRQFAGTGDLVIYLAEHEGEAIAAKMLVRLGDWCWEMFGASANVKRDVKATFLLQYRSMQWAQSRGCSYLDFRTIPQVLEPGEEMWGVYEFKRGFSGFSRLNIPTQDYIYRPLVYKIWCKVVEMRRKWRHRQRQPVELARAARRIRFREEEPQREQEIASLP